MKKNLSLGLSFMFLLTGLLGGCSQEDTSSPSTSTPSTSTPSTSTPAPSSTPDSSEDPFVIVMELAYPPFETKDENGDPMGISVDIGTAFGEYLGREVVIENTAWGGLIPSLETGAADMIISSMTKTEERMESVEFSDAYANALLALLTNTESNISSIEDLNQNGKTIAVKTGSTGHNYALKNLPNTEIIALEDESACVLEVSQGKADAFIYDQLTIYRNNVNNPDTTTAVFIPFQEPDQWCAAFKKGNTELAEQFNEFLVEFTENGGYDVITETHLAEEKVAFDELGFQWFFDFG